MIKRLFVILVVSVILLIFIFSIYSKISQKSQYSQTPLDYFPEQPILVIAIDDLSKTLDNFTSTNMIWSKMEDNIPEQSFKNLKSHIESIVLNNDSSSGGIFSGGVTFIAIYNIEGKSHFLIAKNIIDFKFNNFTNDTLFLENNQKHLYLDYKNPFLIISSSNLMLERFKKNYALELKDINNLKDKMRFSSRMSKISCLIDTKQLLNVYVDSIPNFYNEYLFSKIKNEEWIQFDIDYSPSNLKIVGVSDKKNNIELPPPSYFLFNELVPDNIEFLEKRTLDILIDSNSNLSTSVQAIRFKFFDNIQSQQHDVLVLENPTDSSEYSSLLNMLTIDSLFNNFKNENIQSINKNFFKTYYKSFDLDNKFCFSKDYYILISSKRSKKELEYLLARKSSNDSEKSILQLNDIKNYDQAQSLFFYNSNFEIQNKFDSSHKNSFVTSFLNAIGGINWTINNFSNRYHHGLVIDKTEAKKSERNILWKVNLPPLIWGPYALKNHRTGTKDIVVVDSSNIFYFIGANGKIKWTKTLTSPIIGGISQIDAYKNNKYQMVFNTENYIHILDILGNEIDNFPIQLNFKASNPVAVFDYDKENDYRFVLSSKNGSFYNFNLQASYVNGWVIPKFQSNTTRQIKHFAINGRDYIVSLLKDGSVKILNRKGSNRYSVKGNLPIARNGNFHIKKAVTIDSSSIIFEDSSGNLAEFQFSDLKKPLFDRNVGDSSFLFFSNLKNEPRYYIKNKKELKIIDQSGQKYQYSLPYYFSIINLRSKNNFVPILNNSLGEIQLVDNKYRLNPTTFRGSSMACVEDINSDNLIELISVVNQNILICYQIPKLK